MSVLRLADRVAVVAASGPLRTPTEIADSVFGGKVSARWVLKHVPKGLRHRVGRLIMFYEGDVRRWADRLREVA